MKFLTIAFTLITCALSSTNSLGKDINERLKSCDPKELRTAADEIVSRKPNDYDPFAMFAAANAYFRAGEKDKAAFWFFAAQLLMRQGMILSPSENGGFIGNMFIGASLPITNYAEHDVTKMVETIDEVLQWNAAAPATPKSERNNDYEVAREKARDSLIQFRSKSIANKSAVELAAKARETEADKVFKMWACSR